MAKKKFGRYEIISEIGRGAMGIVYKAKDPKLKRLVAIKQLVIPHGAKKKDKEEIINRFHKEAEAANKLDHPNIVSILDVGEAEGLPFIAMEYVQGGTLADAVEKEQLPPDEIIDIGIQITSALTCAHEEGIIHRDIKPENILLEDGFAKVTDFGIARVLTHTTYTQSGAMLGTPLYMSPEQLKGGKLDGRSDLFSLASLLYELSVGKHPFKGDDYASTLYKVANEEPDNLDLFRRRLSSSQSWVILTCLAKKPEGRPRSAKELKKQFEVVISGKEIAPKKRDQAATTKLMQALVGDEKSIKKTRILRRRKLMKRVVLISLLTLTILGAAFGALATQVTQAEYGSKVTCWNCDKTIRQDIHTKWIWRKGSEQYKVKTKTELCDKCANRPTEVETGVRYKCAKCGKVYKEDIETKEAPFKDRKKYSVETKVEGFCPEHTPRSDLDEYRRLKDRYKNQFPVLYPSYIPEGFTMPARVSGGFTYWEEDHANPYEEEAGFSIQYQKGSAWFEICEGFTGEGGEAGLNERTARVRGHTATIWDYESNRTAVYWMESSVEHVVFGENMSAQELLKIARGLEAL